MTGPFPAGAFEASPARHRGADWAGLSAGTRYRVVEPFRDASGARHRRGQTWTFLGFTLDGEDLWLWVSRDDRREWAIPLWMTQRREGEVAFNLPRYIVEHDPPTAAEHMSDLLSETLGAVESSEASPWSTETTDELATALRAHIASLQTHGTPELPDLHTLFLPTGALQETAIDNGWGALYVDLAERYDRLAPRLRVERAARQRADAAARSRASRRRRTLRRAAAVGGGTAAVLGIAYAAGVLTLVLAVAAILGALGLLAGGGLAWLLSGGLFSRRPIRDAFRKTVASPTALGSAIAFLVADGLLLAWGVRELVRWFQG